MVHRMTTGHNEWQRVVQRENLNRVILAQLNINSIQSKFDLLAEGIKGKVDVYMMSETKIDETFPSRQFFIKGFTPPYRLDWNCHGGGILVYVREDIPSKLIEMKSSSESISIELKLRRSPDNPEAISLLLTNSVRSFQNSCALETGLSDFHKMTVTVLKSYQSINVKLYLIGTLGNSQTTILEHNFCEMFQLCIYLMIPLP